jgi:hypothetical protein
MRNGTQTVSRLLACLLAFAGIGMAQAGMANAENAAWQVAKSSGEVWVTTSGAQQVSLGADTKLMPGDNVRTGRNGRVLLTRGEERIFLSPNSAIGVPSEKKGDLPTTITQQAGSILLDVEKKNVRHFEVETPYLAAVVKGTQFRVTVEKGRSRVEVLRGQVQVADFKSGQNVLLLPGQAARTSANGAGGLQMSGKGRFNAIEQGTPRQSTVRAISVPAGGLRAPASRGPDARRDMRAGQDTRTGREARQEARNDARASRAASLALASASPGLEQGISRNNKGGLRIGSTLGEVKLDFHKVTNGLARGTSDANAAAGGASDRRGRGSESGEKSLSSLSAMSGPDGDGPSLGGVGRGNGGNSAGAANGSGGGNGNGGGMVAAMVAATAAAMQAATATATEPAWLAGPLGSSMA